MSWKLSAWVCVSKLRSLPHSPFPPPFFLFRQSIRLPPLHSRSRPSPLRCEHSAALSLRRDPAGGGIRAIRCLDGQRAFLELGVMSGTEGVHIMGWLAGAACPESVLLGSEGSLQRQSNEQSWSPVAAWWEMDPRAPRSLSASFSRSIHHRGSIQSHLLLRAELPPKPHLQGCLQCKHRERWSCFPCSKAGGTGSNFENTRLEEKGCQEFPNETP